MLTTSEATQRTRAPRLLQNRRKRLFAVGQRGLSGFASVALLLLVAGCDSKDEKMQKLIARLHPAYVGSEKLIGATKYTYNSKDARKAVDGLKKMGPEAVPYLVASLKTNAADFKDLQRFTISRGPARYADGRVDPTVVSKECLQYTLRTCQFISLAAEVLGELKKGASNSPETDEVVAVLADSVRRADENMDGYFEADVRQAIAKIGNSAVPSMMKLLEDAAMRDFAVATLSEIGPPAKSCLPKLQAMLETARDKPASNSLHWAIKRISGAR